MKNYEKYRLVMESEIKFLSKHIVGNIFCEIDVTNLRRLYIGADGSDPIVGLFAKGSPKNLMPVHMLNMHTSYHSSGDSGYNYIANNGWFSSHGIDTDSLTGGVVVFASGLRGIIDIANNGASGGEDSYIYYKIYDGIPDCAIDIKSMWPFNKGWKLLHQFASSDGVPAYNIETINGKKEAINSVDKLDESGIEHYLTIINYGYYTLQKYFMQFFYDSSPVGYIQFRLPEGYSEVLVEYSHHYSGNMGIHIGDDIHDYIYDGYVNYGYRSYEYSGAPMLKITEDGIVWIKAVWVR